MGRTTYPCPGCGQAQTVEHPNGSEIIPALCPACAEKKQREEAERAEEKHGKKAAR